MSAEKGARTRSALPRLVVREATAEDNDSLIALELQSPLLIGDREESFDPSPDFFARRRASRTSRFPSPALCLGPGECSLRVGRRTKSGRAVLRDRTGEQAVNGI